MAAATEGKSRFAGALRPFMRRCIAVLVIAWLVYVIDSLPIGVADATWKRTGVALLSAAGAAILLWVAASWTHYIRSGAARYLGLASASQLPRSAEQVRALMRQEVTARYGQAVWPHLHRRRRIAGTGLVAVGGFLLAFFIYANFSDASGPPLIAGVVMVGAGLLATRVTRRQTELSLQAMERAMSGHTLTASSLRWPPDTYVAWCRARNIEPYPRGRSAPGS